MPRMLSTWQGRPAPRNTVRRIASLALVAAVTAGLSTGLAACSDDDTPSAGDATSSMKPTTPAATGSVSENAAWAAHSPVPAGFTRIASSKLSIGIPDSFEPVNDPKNLGTTDLAATAEAGEDGVRPVISARVIPIPKGETVPEEGPAWAAAADIARAAEEKYKSKDVEIVDSDVEQQDGWKVTWTSPATEQAPALRHVWSLVDIDDSSFAIVSIQGPPKAFKDTDLSTVPETLVIKGVTDGTAPSPKPSS
jgi:hypothetical protein